MPVPVIFILFVFSPIAFAHYEHFKIPTATITIDGNMDDWNNIEPAYVDDVNDENPNADYDGTDLHKLYLAKDDTFLYIMMTLYDGAPKEYDAINDMSTLYFVYFAQSNSDSIGDRVSRVFQYGGRWECAVQEIVDVETNPWSWTWSDIANYSTRFVGIGSNFIEWKAYLADIGTLNGRFIRFWIHTFPEGKVINILLVIVILHIFT